MKIRYVLLLFLSFGINLPLQSQINYVPNHSFEDLTDCDLNFGDIPKAFPWKIVPEPENTPDVFHYCSTSGFYVPPVGCEMMNPKDGEGMIGQAQNIPPEERVYVRLTEDLPMGQDIYVSFSTLPQPKCGNPPILNCYSNTQCLVFSDFAFQNQVVALQSDTVISQTSQWSTLRGCYRASGEEDFLLLGNYRLATETIMDCDTISDYNFSFYFFDEIIVSPFDVLPDTLFLCGDETLTIDASFYDLPILWNDGQQGAIRIVDEGGKLVALGDTGNCFLRDSTIVVKISDERETIARVLCEDDELLLQTPLPAIWPNGDTSTTLVVDCPGTYSAVLLSDCGERVRDYIVEEEDCSIQYFVPNAFSPNFDGINDQLEFFFESEYSFNGELQLLDRWGNQVFQMTVDQSATSIRWDGIFRNKPLGQGVYVWVYQYESAKDGKTRVISGDVVLLR